MKRNPIIFAAGVICLLASCNKDMLSPVTTEQTVESESISSDTYSMAIVLDSPTKTEFHENTIWWSEGDKLNVIQYYTNAEDAKVMQTKTFTLKSQEKVTVTSDTWTMPKEGTEVQYYGVFPAENRVSMSTLDGNLAPRMNIPATQFPKSGSFDPKSDILVSEIASFEEPQKSLTLPFIRVTAIGKLTITDLPVDENVDSIVFDTPYYITGDFQVDMSKGAIKGSYTSKRQSYVTIDCTSLEAKASSEEGLTTFFCCAPFEMASGKSFTVTVYTASNTCSRKITLSEGQSLVLAQGKTAPFSVNMKTADITSDLVLTKYTSGANVPTINSLKAKISSKNNKLASVKYCIVKASDYAAIADLSAYIEENGKAVSQSTLDGLNAGSTYSLPFSGLTIDTEYAVVAKAVDTDGKVLLAKVTDRTDWFKLGLATRSAGGVQVQLCGKELDSKTKNYRIVATSALEGLDAKGIEDYYTSTLAPGGIPTSTLDAVNNNPGVTQAYGATKYYVDKTTQANMESGVSYTIMIKVTNTRGETKFYYASANAK